MVQWMEKKELAHYKAEAAKDSGEMKKKEEAEQEKKDGWKWSSSWQGWSDWSWHWHDDHDDHDDHDGSGIAKIGQRAVGTLIQQQQLQQQQMQEPSWHVARQTQGLGLFKIQEKLVFRNASFL